MEIIKNIIIGFTLAFAFIGAMCTTIRIADKISDKEKYSYYIVYRHPTDAGYAEGSVIVIFDKKINGKNVESSLDVMRRLILEKNNDDISVSEVLITNFILLDN